MHIVVDEVSINPITKGHERVVSTPSASLGILRHQLVKHIGFERLKSFLFSFGWENGVKDAKKAMKEHTSIPYLIKHGPLYHKENGQITGVKHICHLTMCENNQYVKSLYSEGIWYGSYEAEEHIRLHGYSDTPQCHTLVGYASGYMTTITGVSLLVKETCCVAKGDAECKWTIQSQEQWAMKGEDAHSPYEETPIVKELAYTYEQLLDQRNFVTKLAEFQSKLTEEISGGSSLEEITELVYDHMQLPIVIESIDFYQMSSAGLSPDECRELTDDMKQYFSLHMNDKEEKHPTYPLFFQKRIVHTEKQTRLMAPILVQKKIQGYCSFVYEPTIENSHESDYLLLERFANAASLILLNEKTRFESLERMKGSFLERILEGKTSKAEIIKRGKYTGIDLTQSYFLAMIDFSIGTESFEEEFQLQEDIYEWMIRYFSEKKKSVLINMRDHHLIILVPDAALSYEHHEKFFRPLMKTLRMDFPNGEFTIGLSNQGNEITSAHQHYEEALVSLRLSSKENMMSFKQLGIVGVLINSKNTAGVKTIAKQELGALYDLSDCKMVDLLQTLYVFLLNGGKLEQTTIDLNLSMSGLRHRIRKIEHLLEKDLRNPQETHQLFLIIQSLIALGEMKIN